MGIHFQTNSPGRDNQVYGNVTGEPPLNQPCRAEWQLCSIELRSVTAAAESDVCETHL